MKNVILTYSAASWGAVQTLLARALELEESGCHQELAIQLMRVEVEK